MRKKPDIPNEICARIHVIQSRLAAHYGERVLTPNMDPIGQLVATILSQHTTDASSGKAFTELRRRFLAWSDVIDAPQDEVADAIRIAGLSQQKARTIQTALSELRDDSLQSLSTMPVADARARLTAIRGVGDKTASCVLLFALGMPAQPVDTHIERVTKRLGVNAGESSPTGIQHVYEHCLPPDGQTMYAFHLDLVRHGREICQSREPKCSMCILSDLCDYYARQMMSSED